MNIQISGPTCGIHAYREDPEEQSDFSIELGELVDEVVFPGKIELPEQTRDGITKALCALELWADLLCIAVGNPKVIVEIQRPMHAVISTQTRFVSLQRWGELAKQYFQLAPERRERVARALWWYRKASSTAYYSIFDSYTAYWNCLEILCNVSASKVRKGEDVDRRVQDYLRGKSDISSGHISECYNRFVNYSIKEQMKDTLEYLMDPEQASQVICQCFEVKPEEMSLYQIRNDINHGNIRENSLRDYSKVYRRGQLLWNIVMMLINRELGYSISLGKSIDELAKSLQKEP